MPPKDSMDDFEQFIQDEESKEIGREYDSFFKSTRWTRSQKKIALVLGLLLVIGAPVAALTFLFNQQLNAPPIIPTVLTRNCDPVNPTPAQVANGSNGFVIWTCTPTQSAFRVNVAGSVTPTITKGSEWTSTYIFKETTGGVGDPVGNCASASTKYALTSGTSVTFNGNDVGGWRYCSDFFNAQPGMSSITYSWSQ